ncbi:MAG: methionyl-tRNA formyltransferase [Cyclobacteriaceae bacterium]
MEKKDLSIVFMGTPEFAVASLRALVENGFNIVGVVTAPDKPQGRGKQLGISAIKEYALTQNLRVLQPTNLKDPLFHQELKDLAAQVQIVVAFRMLPEIVWDMPPLGSYNLHGSLLPDYRGAAPINWAIINGEEKTGVTTFKLKHEIDTGNILFQEEEIISKSDTVGDVYIRLMHKGAKLVVKTADALLSGKVELSPQNIQGKPKHAPKIFKEDCKIDWSDSADKIHNFVRGLSPYPTAWTEIMGKTMKVYEVEKSEHDAAIPIGHFQIHDKKELLVKTKDGCLKVKDLQLQGKRRMLAEEFLRGFQVADAKNIQ